MQVFRIILSITTIIGFIGIFIFIPIFIFFFVKAFGEKIKENKNKIFKKAFFFLSIPFLILSSSIILYIIISLLENL